METAEIKSFIEILHNEFQAEDELNGFKSGAIDNAKISIKEQALIDNGFFVGGLNEDQIEYYYQTMVDTKNQVMADTKQIMNNQTLNINSANKYNLPDSGIPQLQNVSWTFGGTPSHGHISITAELPDGSHYENTISGEFGQPNEGWHEISHLELVSDDDENVLYWYYIDCIDPQAVDAEAAADKIETMLDDTDIYYERKYSRKTDSDYFDCSINGKEFNIYPTTEPAGSYFTTTVSISGIEGIDPRTEHSMEEVGELIKSIK